MKNTNISQWIVYKFLCLFLLVLSLILIYSALFFAHISDLYLMLKHGDIITYNSKVIIFTSGIPMYIYLLFFSLKSLFRMESSPLKKQTIMGNLWGGISIISFISGFIAAIIIPSWLIFSSYKSCPEKSLSEYYVTDQKLCKTIVLPDQWW